MSLIYSLPTVNALLNGLAALLLLLGFRAIRQGHREIHRKFMVAAFATSIVFLGSYLVYHFNVRSVPFTFEGPARYVYYVVLVSHVILAALVPFLAFGSLYLAARMRFDTHKMLSRVTFPIWMYVSVTGVIVYVMLYHLYPSAAIPRPDPPAFDSAHSAAPLRPGR